MVPRTAASHPSTPRSKCPLSPRVEDPCGAVQSHRFRRTRARSACRTDIDRYDADGLAGPIPRSPRFAPCRKVRMHVPALFGVTASLALGAAAPASIVVFNQTGTMTVHGQFGMLTTTAPATAPWFRSISSGGGGTDWFAQAFMVSTWSSTQISIYAEALVDPGAGAPRLTQSLTDISVHFAIANPTLVHVDFSAHPNDAGPGVPLNQFAMQLLHSSSGSVLAQGDINTQLWLTPGDYTLVGVNNMGNHASNLGLTEDGARMLSMQITTVPGVASAISLLAGAAILSGRRRRGN
jgi:hypothetical protein